MNSKEQCFEATGTTARTRKHIKGCLKKQLKDTYNREDLYEEFLKIQGLDDSKFDYIDSVANMIYSKINGTSVQASSIDHNANRSSSAVTAVFTEADAPIHKLVGYDFLYRQLKENVGKKEANRIMSLIYDYSLAVNDATKLLMVYCWALNGAQLVMEGRKGSSVEVSPAKHLLSYINMLLGTMQQLSSSSLAGAVACGSMFTDICRILLTEGYTKEDIESNEELRHEVKQMYQTFVYSAAVDEIRDSAECMFSNLSIFDREKLRGIVEDMDWYFYDTGKEVDYIIEFIIVLQDLYMDFMDIGDPVTGIPFTFPVNTVNIAKNESGELLDMKFVEDFCKRPVHKYNIMVSAGSKVASCCFDGKQKVIFRLNSKIYLDSFENFFDSGKYNYNGVNFCVFHNGRWAKARRVVVPYDKKYYKITTANHKTIVVTEDHLNPTIYGDKCSSSLTTDDYLLFNTAGLPESRESSNNYNFDDGYAVGLFLGDGSYIIDNNHDVIGVNFSLNKDCIDECDTYITKFLDKFGAKTIRRTPQNNTNPLVFYSKDASSFISNFVNGNRSYTKSLNLNSFFESVAFRKGVLAGWYASDGGNSNRCYTVSKDLLDTMEALCTSLGIQTIVDVSNRVGTNNVIIRGKTFNRNYPLYCLRFYDNNTKHQYKDVFIRKNNSIYFKIVSIELVNGTDEAYCVSISDKKCEPYFTLPNGIITHNCRLTSDADLLKHAGSMNSFGGGGAGNLGSHRVVVINTNRAAILATSEEDFYSRVSSLIKDATDILRAHKDMLIKLESIGLQPAITNGLIDINRLFSTYGVIATWETCQTLDRRFGKDPDRDIKLATFINEESLKFGSKSQLLVNQECIPAESMAVRLAKADRMLFGDKYVPCIYSNQAIPLTEDVDVFERMDRWGRLDKAMTGGGIVHLTINEPVSSEQALHMIKYSVRSGSEHFAFNLLHSKCLQGHIVEGKFEKCPQCDAEVIDYALRVVGFLRWTSSWSKERQEEFKDRKINKLDF